MLIDWFTVIAQVVNFLVLVWLLKRFLYKPILSAIDAREKLIAGELAEADAKKAAAEKLQADFSQRSEAFDRERQALLRQAEADAAASRLVLLQSARKEFEEHRLKWQETLKADERHFNQALSDRAQLELFETVRKVLLDLANEGLENQIIEVFIKKLGHLEEAKRRDLSSSFGQGGGSLILRTVFPVAPDQQIKITAAVQEVLGISAPISFETSADLVGGIELLSDGHKIHWNISDYLSSLEERVNEIIKLQIKAAPAASEGGKPNEIN